MSELDSFLGAQPEPKPEPAAPAPAPEAKQPEAAPAKADAKAEPQPDPEDEIGHDGGMITPSSFHKARTDWKTKVVAAETEARLLRQQLEAIQKPPPQAQPQQPPPPPEPQDPVRDPVG